MLPWQPINVVKSAFFADQSSLSCWFGNGLQYRNSDFKRLNRIVHNFGTFCPVTSEFTPLTITHFAAIWQKSAYHAKYLRISWSYLDLLYRFGRCVGGDDYPDIFVWRSPKGCWYGNQLNLGDVCRHRHEWPLLFALAFINGLADREAAFERLNGIIRLHRVQFW